MGNGAASISPQMKPPDSVTEMTRDAKLVRIDLYGQAEAGDRRHAQEVMRSLGITYKEAIPSSVLDRWDFLFCENVPDELPKFMTARDEIPEMYHKPGYGRSQEDVDTNGI